MLILDKYEESYLEMIYSAFSYNCDIIREPKTPDLEKMLIENEKDLVVILGSEIDVAVKSNAKFLCLFDSSLRYAKENNLQGIFLHNVIINSTDIAMDFGIVVEEELIQEINRKFAERLGTLLSRVVRREIELQELPDILQSYVNLDAAELGNRPIIEYNYWNLVWRGN